MTNDKWLLSHCVYLPDDHGLSGTILHNPRSNLNNGVGYANPARFENPVALGTDGIGANMIESFRLAYVMQRSVDVTVGPDPAWIWLMTGLDLVPEARKRRSHLVIRPHGPMAHRLHRRYPPRRGQGRRRDRVRRWGTDQGRRPRDQSQGARASSTPPRTPVAERRLDVRPLPAHLDGTTHRVGVHGTGGEGLHFRHPAHGVLRADRRRPHQQQNYGTTLETPLGVAAGPHTQMAQNIIVSWLVGARFIELKTVQTLDELDVNKPCIDLEDEGYNVEWSQELKVHQSFDEYLRAWVLIHALHHHLGFPGEAPGMEFNMSVGYNLEGILNPNVQWYLDVMNDASEYLDDYISVVAEWYPAVRDIDIPAQLSDTITLSTMHGCPPDEIEAITSYLMSDRGIHTSVKCNPTLLGPAEVRSIVNDELGYSDIVDPGRGVRARPQVRGRHSDVPPPPGARR